MRKGVKQVPVFAFFLLSLAVFAGGIAVWAATKTVDLDGNGSAESSCALNILSTFPPKVENVVTNKALGASFNFNWVSAGLGGFIGSVGPGTTAGVGAKWTWQTSKAIYSFTGTTCANDICFTATGGLPPGTVRGPFRVPGRSLVASGVTLSNASLTSSLVTFFSHPKTILSATSSVGQPGSGQISYSTTLANNSGAPLTVHVEAGPPGCCPSANQLNCEGTCVDYLTDPENCGGCGVECDTFHGQICDDGECVSTCSEGQVLCGETCVSTYSNPLHCGSCENACGENQICAEASCFTCCGETPTACDNECVDTDSDPENCGGCGVSCASQCEGAAGAYCSEGCCHCVYEDYVGSGTTAPAASKSGSSWISADSVIETLPPPAPICETQAATETIPAGESASLGCNSAAYLAKEVFSFISACLDGSTPNPETGLCGDGSGPVTGPFAQLVPDLNHPISSMNVVLSPVGAGIIEVSGNGLIEPGELAVLNLSLSNSGVATLRDVMAILTSPPQDITPDDGMDNPAAVNILFGKAWYPPIPGAPAGSSDCGATVPPNPIRALTPLLFFVPHTYLGDTSRIFNLHVTGTADGVPFAQDVPVTLGIAGKCDPADVQGNFDVLRGLHDPMAMLIPEEDNRPLPFPRKKFSAGKALPLSLNVGCRWRNLDDTNTLAPKIVGLFNLTTGLPVSLSGLNANPPDPDAPYFRYDPSSDKWKFLFRTMQLTAGEEYRLTIEIGGRKNYVTGFELK